jgi:hypothetical protein
MGLNRIIIAIYDLPGVLAGRIYRPPDVEVGIK